MVVVLGSSTRLFDAADLCIWATVSSLLGSAIEAQKLADQIEVACRTLDSELQAAVVASSPEVAKPVAVRYDWANNPIGNLRSAEGLPACPFRTDVPPTEQPPAPI